MHHGFSLLHFSKFDRNPNKTTAIKAHNFSLVYKLRHNIQIGGQDLGEALAQAFITHFASKQNTLVSFHAISIVTSETALRFNLSTPIIGSTNRSFEL